MADSPNFQDFVELDESSALAAIGGAVKIFSGGAGGQSLVMGNDPATSVGTLIWNPQTTRTISLPDANGVLALGSQTIAVGVSTGGNTAGNTGTTVGTLVLAGAGIVTLSQSTAPGSLATISISATQSTQPGVTAIGVSTGGNTSGNTGTTQGTYVLAGGNNITLSQATAAGSLATVTISGANAVFGAGVSTGGNTSGTTGTVTGTVVLAGGNNITLSQSTNASGATITVSGANAVLGLGVSTGGNTAGNTGTTFGTIVLVGGGEVTLSQSTAAGSLATITISSPRIGIAAGTQTMTSGTAVFSNSNNVTFGMSNSSVVTATVENRLTNFVWPTEFQATFFTISNASLSLQKIYMPMHLTGTRMQVLMDLTGSSNSTGALTISVAVYTLTGSTASLASSGSRQISWSSGSATTVSTIYGGVSGTRYRTISLGLTMTPGDYLFAFNLLTTNNGTWRMFGPQAVSIVGALDANETNYYLNGSSASSTTAFPGSINVTDTNYVRTGLNALRQPGFILIGTF